jgi:hypothetical protein
LWSPPALWRPRAGPWWRLPALFTGKFQRGSDGKLRRGTDGKMRTHDPASPKPVLLRLLVLLARPGADVVVSAVGGIDGSVQR